MSTNLAQKAPRRFPGKVVAIALMASIIVAAIVAQIIHDQNLRVRQEAAHERMESETQGTSRP